MEEKTALMGDPESEKTEIGPVVDKAQFDRVMSIIDAAKAERQGTLLMGGKVKGTKVGSHFYIHLYLFHADLYSGLLH